MKLLANLIINTFSVVVGAYLLTGVFVQDLWVALMVALVLGILNLFFKPLLVLLTLPITILTLGLFSLVINALLVLLASEIVPGFYVTTFWWALLFSVIVSFVNSFLQTLSESK